MHELPLISVFILNWNRKNELLLAIDSAKKQTYPNIEILVVDNASTDGAPELVEEKYPDVKLVRLDKNYGCPGGRNRGIPHCCGEFIFYADNDGLLHRQAVENAYKRIIQDDRIVVVGGAVKLFDDVEQTDLSCPLPGEEAYKFTGVFHGGVSMHRKSIYDKVGVYPDNYMYAGEENHLAMRIMEYGGYIVRDENVVLWHKKSPDARDKVEELLCRQMHALANHIQFWPLELLAIYIMRTLVVHPVLAVKTHVFGSWIKKWPISWIRIFCREIKNRKPIKRQTVQRNYYLHWNQIKDIDLVDKDPMPYWKFLIRLFGKG